MQEKVKMNNTILDEVTFVPLKPNDKGLIGVASVLYNNSLSLNCISVYIRPNGDLRLLFPVKTLPNSRSVNTYYPINRETYEAIRKVVSEKYHNLTKDTFEP